MSNPTDRLIIGTAGHIDHGKSTLVRRLTGIDPDRLKEEKERGITIVLGFAPLSLPSGRRCGVVDVPGHERLVRTMIAGASGIDIILLVVAADEGVMPQTREHLAICELLGVEHGVVALTKIDTVDEEWLELVQSDLRDELADTFMAQAAIVPCSSTTGQGTEALLRALDGAADRAKRRNPDGLLRMPMDRVFTMKGFGTVATGTLVSGHIAVNETVELLPSGLQGRVRGLQVHGEAVESSVAGTRTAVNIQGSEVGEVHPGEWFVHPATIEQSRRLDAKIQLLPIFPRPLKKRFKVLVHAGTTHVEAVVRLLDAERLEPGASCHAHLELATPIVALAGDRLILRGTERLAGHGHTIGGARVIRPLARRPRKPSKALEEILELDTARDDNVRIATLIRQAGPTGIGLKELLQRLDLGPSATRQLIKELTKSGDIILFGQHDYVHTEQLGFLEELAKTKVTEFHAAKPLEPGMPREELRSKLPAVTPALFGLVLERLKRGGEVVVEADIVRQSAFAPKVDPASGTNLDELKDQLAKRLEATGLTPPRDKELAAELGRSVKEIGAALKLLANEATVVKVAEGLHFATTHVKRLEAEIVKHLENDSENKLTAQQFKAITGASRKFTIPLGEYFDRQKLTMRVGDARVLRRRLDA